MATLSQSASNTQAREPLPALLMGVMVWHVALFVAAVVVGIQLFDGLIAIPDAIQFYEPGEFYRLGDPVQYFLGLVILTPGILALLSNYLIYQRDNNGRYIALALNFVGAVLSGAYLLHVWGVYEGFDAVTPALLGNTIWFLGIAAGYAIYWAAGRLKPADMLEVSRAELVGVAVAMLSLFGMLLASGLLDALSSIIGTYTSPRAWAVTVAMLIFGVFSYRVLLMGAYFGETTEQREAWQGWLMLSPNMVGFALFFAGPLLFSFYLSFTDAAVGQVPEVIGLGNYADLLALQLTTIEEGQLPGEVLAEGYRELTRINFGDTEVLIGATDPLFWTSMRNTLYFCLLLVPLSTLPALLLATILNSQIPGMKFYRAVYFVPSVAAVVGTALIWRWLYDPLIGYYNYFITEITMFLGQPDPELEWLNDRATALPAVVLLAAWRVVGFNTVLFLAGLQGIPRTLYEAAYVDGANLWQRFRHVTVPMLAPTTFFVIITTVIQGLQVFEDIFAMFPARPVPEHVMTAVYYLYDQGFFRFQFGYASGVAWLLFGVIFVITLAQFRLSRATAYED
ncbi:MAG: carbohydrate ABC transporter permease [Anaerolineales bacterium]